MLSYRVTLLSVACLSLRDAVAFAKKSDLNGWYPCSDVTFSDEGNSSDIAECAVYKAPLCHFGICETLPSVDPTVDIFVKRFPATSEDPATASNVWFLQGGPGDSSSALELDMRYLHTELEGKANIYTMDHRGTGRSTRLDCVAAQATTSGSPFGNDIELSEVAACAQDLEYKYGDLSSFSMTSAATDVATFITKFTNGKNTIVYGISYGTALVERLMHLETPTIIGYVLDGVSTTAAAAKNKFPYFSMGDVDFGEVGDHFLDLCIDDEGCSRHFKSKSLSASLQHLVEKFDKEPESACAQLVTSIGTQVRSSPSSSLRGMLGLMLSDAAMRAFIPPLIYRLTHCEEGDVIALTRLFTGSGSNTEYDAPDIAYRSPVLYYLIVFSELWETPAPTFKILKKRITDATMYSGSFSTADAGSIYEMMNRFYCAFSKEKSPACDEVRPGNNGSSAIVYKRDQYWNATAVIPSHASVLLLSSKMDVQTPHKYAEFFYEGLEGSNKELVAFEYADHGTLMTTAFAEGEFNGICGMKLLASYVKNDGNLARLDRSCLDKMPVLNLTTPMAYELLGTDDAYDGRTTRAATSFHT